jgi:hypothetical protein
MARILVITCLITGSLALIMAVIVAIFGCKAIRPERRRDA